jgi:hypothetical protein
MCNVLTHLTSLYIQPVPTSNMLVITVTLKPYSAHTRKWVVIFTQPTAYLKKDYFVTGTYEAHNWYTVMFHIMMPDFIKFEWPCNAKWLNLK